MLFIITEKKFINNDYCTEIRNLKGIHDTNQMIYQSVNTMILCVLYCITIYCK